MIGQVLRSADNAMTTGDVGAAVADRKNVPADDRDTRSWLAVRLGIVLNGLERGKAVTGIRMPGERSVRWRTVP